MFVLAKIVHVQNNYFDMYERRTFNLLQHQVKISENSYIDQDWDRENESVQGQMEFGDPRSHYEEKDIQSTHYWESMNGNQQPCRFEVEQIRSIVSLQTDHLVILSSQPSNDH